MMMVKKIKNLKHDLHGRNMVEDLAILRDNEDFWEIARNEILLKNLDRSPVLDVGCGIGEITKYLLEKKLDVYSIDIDPKACEYTKKFNKNTFCLDFTKVDTNKFPKFEIAILADSLEHMEDDINALKAINKLLKIGGKVVISVPYHNFLWTRNDEARHHYRRYSKKDLKNKLINAGFNPKIKFWNIIAIPPILVAKIFSFRIPHEKISSSKLNDFLKWYLLKVENKLPLFMGSELICEAEKIKEID